MRYTIQIATRAKKQIEILPEKIKEKIANAIEDLSFDPGMGKVLKAQLKGLFSYRVGSYRIIYQIVRKKLIVQIISVRHRKDAYRT